LLGVACLQFFRTGMQQQRNLLTSVTLKEFSSL
jgi:hypothetical protein